MVIKRVFLYEFTYSCTLKQLTLLKKMYILMYSNGYLINLINIHRIN